MIENLFYIVINALFGFSQKKKKSTFTYSLKVLVNKKKIIKIYKYYDYTSKKKIINTMIIPQNARPIQCGSLAF